MCLCWSAVRRTSSVNECRPTRSYLTSWVIMIDSAVNSIQSIFFFFFFLPSLFFFPPRWPWRSDRDTEGKDPAGELAECEIPGLAELGLRCYTSRLCWLGDHRARHDPLYLCACSATSEECGSVMIRLPFCICLFTSLHTLCIWHRINLYLKYHFLFNQCFVFNRTSLCSP